MGSAAVLPPSVRRIKSSTALPPPFSLWNFLYLGHTAQTLTFKGTYPAFCSTFPSSQSRGSNATFSWPTTITGKLPTNSHSVAGMPRALQDKEGWRSRGKAAQETAWGFSAPGLTEMIGLHLFSPSPQLSAPRPFPTIPYLGLKTSCPFCGSSALHNCSRKYFVEYQEILVILTVP